MKNKKLFLVLAILLIAVLVTGSIIYVNKISNNKIPGDYIAVFHGGSGEITYETYIYKENTGEANYGFKFINVTNTTVSWGSSETNSKITKRGTVSWTSDVFKVAKENGAYDYVTIPNSDEHYTIEQFMSMFLMN